MTKPASTTKKTRKQHTPEFRNEALRLAERIGVAAAARELSLYESQLYNWRSKQLKMPASNGNWLSRQRSWPLSKRQRHTSRSA